MKIEKEVHELLYEISRCGLLSKSEIKTVALLVINEKIKYHESFFDKGFKEVHIALSSPIKTYSEIMNPSLEYLKKIKEEIIKKSICNN